MSTYVIVRDGSSLGFPIEAQDAKEAAKLYVEDVYTIKRIRTEKVALSVFEDYKDGQTPVLALRITDVKIDAGLTFFVEVEA